MTMNVSRTDLLAWLNDLLQINYTKVEQCGTGGAYCQILDSIYGEIIGRNQSRASDNTDNVLFTQGDIPMARVKMNAKHEYEFVANYKIMQNVFKAKKIDKVYTRKSDIKTIPLTRLVAYTCRKACEMQNAVGPLRHLPSMQLTNISAGTTSNSSNG
jgi:hypothetical protein